MWIVSTSHWRLLERLSPTAFLVGGILVFGHAAIRGIQALTDLATPADVFAPAGHLVAIIGLFGLYPMLTDRSPRSARVAVVVAMVPATGWALITISQLGDVIMLLSPQTAVLPEGFAIVVLLSTILTYLLFGVVSLHAEVHSRTISLLILAPAALLIVLIASAATMGVSALAGFVIGTGLSLAMLALGYTLRTWIRPTNTPLSVSDVIAR